MSDREPSILSRETSGQGVLVRLALQSECLLGGESVRRDAKARCDSRPLKTRIGAAWEQPTNLRAHPGEPSRSHTYKMVAPACRTEQIAQLISTVDRYNPNSK